MRNTFLVALLVLIAVAGGVYLFLYGPNNLLSTPSPTTVTNQSFPTTVQFRELTHGQKSTVTTRANYIITSSAQLSQLWKMIDAGTRTPPIVDFTKDDVIAVFAGDESTAGYMITVSKIEDTQTRMVTILLTKPGISCVVAESITSPYQIIKVPKTTLSLTHTDTIKTVSCLQ